MKTNKTDHRSLIIIFTILISAVILGVWIGRKTSADTRHDHVAQTAASHEEHAVWTCAMHPQIRQDHPGTCPICGMELIPVDETSSASNLPVTALKMSPAAMQLASIRTIIVKKGSAAKNIALTGRVVADPEFAYTQSAYVSGRVERLFVNKPGEYVKQGERIAELFSPEVFDAQKELIQSYKTKNLSLEIFEAVKKKLRLWRISEAFIDHVLETGKAEEVFPVFAGQSGFLTEKKINAGDYVQTGSEMFTVSRLNRLWGVFDVYEKDVVFVRPGMSVAYAFTSMPGKQYRAKIDFVEPVVDPVTRTVSVRIDIPNPGMNFKPGMFITGNLKAEIGRGADEMVIPASAVMWTGKRSVVYVKYTSDNEVGFEMRPVVLGASVDGGYVVEDGLSEGEEIVAEGTFSVDAAAQLADRPSMMNPVHRQDLPEVTLSAHQKMMLQHLFDSYFVVKDDLTRDQFLQAKSSYLELINTWRETDWSHLPMQVQKTIVGFIHNPALDADMVNRVEDIKTLRNRYFYDLSLIYIELAEAYGAPGKPLYVLHCPMSQQNKGADWLSREAKIVNPYFGASMINCGEVRKTMH